MADTFCGRSILRIIKVIFIPNFMALVSNSFDIRKIKYCNENFYPKILSKSFINSCYLLHRKNDI